MPGTKKTGRNAAHRRAAAQAAARQARERRQRRIRTGVAAVIAIVVVLAVVLATVPGDGGDDNAAVTTTTTAPEETSTTVPVEFTYGEGECAPDTKPETKPESFASAPKRCLEEGVDYAATVETSHGTFSFDLLEAQAPGTVNNFVQLAKWGWFDGLGFHRVVKGFVNQTGDPKGDGTGGPGYTIADELPASVAEYVPGAIAMANSGPNTNGSQWFTCIDCSKLPTAGYSLFGLLIDGMDVIEAINALSTGDGPPTEPVTVISVTIEEG